MQDVKYCLQCGVSQPDTTTEEVCDGNNGGPHVFEQPVDAIVGAVAEEDNLDAEQAEMEALTEMLPESAKPTGQYWSPEDMLRTMGYITDTPNDSKATGIDGYLRDALDNEDGESIACCTEECIIPYNGKCEHGHPALTTMALATKFGAGATIEMLVKSLKAKGEWTEDDQHSLDRMASESPMVHEIPAEGVYS